ncbi:unnamed protein product [Gongylonema pulchrum]|uniref:SSD domain-containing protein n=1 Tax=Gongylonema pulchrum TaxID=637853 RepID=A0A183E7X9_9BILA|nr:unnamed protein product [Gongylonema pulchrum]
MITPFLVLGIGVDDAFLLMHSWFYSQAVASSRFCNIYLEVGPSITLSSVTNVAAFLVCLFCFLHKMITPFLVLGIGVDDAFLLMHSWFYSQAVASSRFCNIYLEVGPSITLSSITNVAAFLVCLFCFLHKY